MRTHPSLLSLPDDIFIPGIGDNGRRLQGNLIVVSTDRQAAASAQQCERVIVPVHRYRGTIAVDGQDLVIVGNDNRACTDRWRLRRRGSGRNGLRRCG